MVCNPNDVSFCPLRRSRWDEYLSDPRMYRDELPHRSRWPYDRVNSLYGSKPYPDYIDLFGPKGSPEQNTSMRYYPLRDRVKSADVPRTTQHTCLISPPKPTVTAEVKSKSQEPQKNKVEETQKNKVDSDSKNAPNNPTKNAFSIIVEDNTQKDQDAPKVVYPVEYFPEAPILNQDDSRERRRRPKSMINDLFVSWKLINQLFYFCIVYLLVLTRVFLYAVTLTFLT